MSEAPDHQRSSQGAGKIFATTHWSLVVAAAGQDSPDGSAAALEQLCQKYWYPLYAYVRRRGFSAEESSDLTQAFFAQILEKKFFDQADPQRGKFRTFLLTSLKNFVNNQWRSERAKKRGGHLTRVSLEISSGEKRYALEPVESTTPEHLFERKWALALLTSAFEKLQAEYDKPNKRELFERIKPYLVGNRDNVPYKQVARELGITENAVKVAVHRLRKRCGTLLLDEIAQTVQSEEDVDEELREMYSSLGRH